mmetsp:Transcript_11188/g.31128  ORF Transcript_11188/g.31128 Transcript_11188/m.31128 type:complete len:119 (-) Transcript_11188:81-437(-)
MAEKDPRLNRSRSVLTREQVIEIYAMREVVKKDSACKVAKKYGVCEKAVRDIWNGRTWGKLTNAAKNRTESQRGADSTTQNKIPCATIQIDSSEPPVKVDEHRLLPIDDLLFVWSGCL